MRMHRSFTAIICLCFAPVTVFAQTTRNVPAQYPTIQAAISASSNGDTVLVQPGTYSGIINFLGRAVTVTSAGGSGVTTIVTGTGGRAVTFASNEGPNSVLNGFTITAGAGGVLIQNASPTITDCRFLNCVIATPTSESAAGILCVASAGNSAPTVSNCRFDHCLALIGSSAASTACTFLAAGGTLLPTLNGCIARNGVAASAAGPTSSGPTLWFLRTASTGTISPSIINCLIDGNQGGPATIFSDCASVLAQSIRITNNTGATAISLFASNPMQANFTGCLIAGNGSGVHANFSGGGSISFQSCTVTNNGSTASNTGLLCTVYTGAPQLQVTVQNSIVYGNTLVDAAAFGNATITASFSDVGVGNWTYGPGTITSDPRFVDVAGGDFHLSSSSPCVNAGNPTASGLPTLDLDGTPRVIGTAVDMGVDEKPLAAFPGSNEDLDLNTWVDGAGDPLASTITAGANHVVRVRLATPGGTFVGAQPLLFGLLRTTGQSAGSIGGFPSIQMNVNAAVLMYGAILPPLQAPGLPPTGIDLYYLIPPSLAGQTVRLQCFAVSPTAANGLFAASAAHDVNL